MIQDKLTTQYFTGTQAKILMNNDVLLDEVNSISGQYQFSQIPTYGYASHHFDAVSPGKGIAQGTITINYIFAGYLFANMRKAKSLYGNYSNPNASSSPEKETFSTVDDGYYKDITSFLTAQEGFNEMLYLDADLMKKYREAYWNTSPSTGQVPPEFAGPFNIHIKDFRMGSIYDIEKNLDYEEKVISNVFINGNATERRSDGGITMDTYSFIAKAML